MCRHADFCPNPTHCDICDPLWCAKSLLDNAERQAKERARANSVKNARAHWGQLEPKLACNLCEKTPKTWEPPTRTGKIAYQWYERQFRDRSITLCPTCGAGLWYTHAPTIWKIQEPKWKSEHTSATSEWGRNKQKLVTNEITKARGEDKYRGVTDSQLKEAKERKSYKTTTEQHPKYNSVAKLNHIKPKLVEKPTRDLSLVWKEDKKLEKENEEKENRNTTNETQKKRKKISK
jgi:hypothetical protein